VYNPPCQQTDDSSTEKYAEATDGGELR